MFGVSLVVMFTILLLVGGRAFQLAPPMPDQVVMMDEGTPSVIFTSDDIRVGRDVWRRLGGMELGSVWGHGGYLAPDWTADVLHREALAMLGAESEFTALSEPERAARVAAHAARIRVNTYDPATGQITVSRERAEAIDTVVSHYTALFGGTGDGPEALALRKAFAIPNSPLGGRGYPCAHGMVVVVDVLGGLHPAPRRPCHLHQQLAARAPGRQQAERLNVHLDVYFHCPAHRRCGSVVLVLPART